MPNATKKGDWFDKSIPKMAKKKTTSAERSMPKVFMGKDGKKYLPFYTKNATFSNHFPCPEFEHNGRKFSSSEQLYFYLKAAHFKDKETALEIASCHNPNTAKRLSREIRNHDSEEWKRVSVNYMYQAVKIKFTSSPHLKNALLSTEDGILVEASPRDTFWGVGLGTSSPDIADPSKWRGKNTLGQVLMRVREELRATVH